MPPLPAPVTTAGDLALATAAYRTPDGALAIDVILADVVVQTVRLDLHHLATYREYIKDAARRELAARAGVDPATLAPHPPTAEMAAPAPPSGATPTGALIVEREAAPDGVIFLRVRDHAAGTQRLVRLDPALTWQQIATADGAGARGDVAAWRQANNVALLLQALTGLPVAGLPAEED